MIDYKSLKCDECKFYKEGYGCQVKWTGLDLCPKDDEDKSKDD